MQRVLAWNDSGNMVTPRLSNAADKQSSGIYNFVYVDVLNCMLKYYICICRRFRLYELNIFSELYVSILNKNTTYTYHSPLEKHQKQTE